MVNVRFPFLTVLAGSILFTASLSFSQISITQYKLLAPAITATANPAFVKHLPTPQGALSVYDHGDPTADEQYELELINRARANPAAEGVLLFNTTDPYLLQNAQGHGNSPSPSQVKADFATYPARPPLAFNKDIIAAARRHSQDMLDHNYQAHVSPTDGTDPFQRMQQAGYTGYDFAGENIFAYGNDLDEINQEFEYDFGNPGLGHRENLINYANYVYSEVGLGILYGGSGGGNVGPIITTEDFGHVPGNIFITGVVYGDDNHNNFYDVGEGLPGVTITASNGWSAISSTSGGYAIPVTAGDGTVTITASGGPLTADISHQADVSDVNVKVDFIQGGTGYPAQAILIAPISDTVINTDTAHFSWNAITGVTKYHIQVATDQSMSKTTLVLNDSTLTTPKTILKGLKDGMTYYWRVQARNAIGLGQYSPVVSFTVGLPLKVVSLVAPADKADVGSTNDITLSWHDFYPNAADSFWVEVSTSPAMTNHIHSDTLHSIDGLDTTITYSIADFQSPALYFWRVRGGNLAGWGPPSPVRWFSTGTVSVRPTPSQPFGSIASPNPTSNETHIRFIVDNTADVSLKIFGVTGIEESIMKLGTLAPNSYDVTWNASEKPAGMYFYELSAGNKRDIGRIVVVK